MLGEIFYGYHFYPPIKHNFLQEITYASCVIEDYLLTLLGSTMVSGQPLSAEDGGTASSAAASFLHELSSSTASFLGFTWRSWWFSCTGDATCSAIAAGFSSLLLVWSEDGDEGSEAEDGGACGSATAATSSENMDMSWSSSSLSKNIGDSKNATESLADRRWAPRRADEKSRNSSTHDDVDEDNCCCCWGEVLDVVVAAEFGMKFDIVDGGTLWWGKGGQFWGMVGILGGNCAIPSVCVWPPKYRGIPENFVYHVWPSCIYVFVCVFVLRK